MARANSHRSMRLPPRATRNKTIKSYAESSESNDGLSDADFEFEAQNPTPVTRRSMRATVKRRSPHKRPRTPPHHPEESEEDQPRRRRRKASKPQTPRSSTSTHTISKETEEPTGVIPPWNTLPYHILVQIFEYATYPLYDDHTFQPLPSGRWLLDVAHLCRHFAEPAFTVLYKSPPLVPMVQAHRLVDLLKQPPTSVAFKYRQKVRSLRIDVGQVAAYSLPGSGHLDLYGLVKDLPLLDELEFYHQKDMSPYRNLDDTIKWTYPESIFEALEHVDPEADGPRGDKTQVRCLKSWRWSSRLAGKKFSIEKIPQMHAKPFFALLEKVAFVNYQFPDLKKDEEDPKHEQILASALKALPQLKHVIFESSTLANAKLFPLLPTTLRNLELINCWEVVAEDFAPFLLTHGRHLRALTLNHNQSLNLSFLPTLGPACPNLEVFRMNLTYFNLHATYHDSEPQYDQLLLPDQVPAWPSKLQIIEFTHMRKWENDAAEMFFQSLLDSAGNLPDLRRLNIQAILNIAWRDRAVFRIKWIDSFEKVFKRVSEAPQMNFSLPKPPPPETFTLPHHTREKRDLTGEELIDVAAKRASLRSRDIITSQTSPSMSSSPQPPVRARRAQASPPTRRSARASARNLPTGKYAESSDDSDGEVETEEPAIPTPKQARRARMLTDLSILKETAGHDSPNNPLSPNSLGTDLPSEDDSSNSTKKRKGQEVQFIQGMCDVVEIRIDNLRPTETQVTEADFLDSERSGDDEWVEDDDGEVSYAW